MEETPELRWVREVWNSDTIRFRDGRWIAVQGSAIVAEADSLRDLLTLTQSRANPPLLVHVVLGRIQ